MFARLFTTNTKAPDPLSDLSRAEAFFRALPSSDSVAMQRRLCQALADFCARNNQDRARLRALLTLDVLVQPVAETLLTGPKAPAQPRAAEVARWQAAFELARSFAGAHVHALRSMRDGYRSKDCREHLLLLLARLFHHRRMELLLRPYADEGSSRFPWKELHEMYKLALSSGLLREVLPVSGHSETANGETTLEHEYVLALLQDILNGGQMPPHDAFWVARRFARLCRPIKLEQDGASSNRHWFGVDVEGEGGPMRVAPQAPGHWRYIDTSQLLASIDDAVASLRSSPSGRDFGTRPGRGHQLRLLRRIADVLSPDRAVTTRRGDRTPVALSVEVVVGMEQIVRRLRNKPEESVAAMRPKPAVRQDETFTTMGGFTEMQSGMFPASGDSARSSTLDAFDAPHPPLTMVDRSDSGCRLHGPTHARNPIMPGMLLAFREIHAVTWTLGVVRRVRKRLGGKRAEIGVEFFGSDARRIVVMANPKLDEPDGSQTGEDDRFAAIFLPESRDHPTLPIKTLILPGRGLMPADRLSVRSRSAIYSVVLKEPFEEQADFAWMPFDIVDRWTKEESKPVPMGGAR